MNRKDIKNWVKTAIEKKYDKSDLNDLLSEMHEQGKLLKEDWDAILEEYDDTVAEVEKLKLSFFQKRRIKKALKKIRKLNNEATKRITEIGKDIKSLTKKEKKDLEELKMKMIEAIMGNKDKNISGLIDVFEVEDEDGTEITKEKLIGFPIEDIQDLFNELLEQLEKEI